MVMAMGEPRQENRTTYDDRVSKGSGEPAEIPLLPNIQGRLETEAENKQTEPAQESQQAIAKPSRDIFGVMYSKDIDRQLSPRPPTGEELNPDLGKFAGFGLIMMRFLTFFLFRFRCPERFQIPIRQRWTAFEPFSYGKLQRLQRGGSRPEDKKGGNAPEADESNESERTYRPQIGNREHPHTARRQFPPEESAVAD